ncbi:MAG TPA: extracellular solute-binding protein [Nitrososphaeraceae archaeon]|jgi:multiple sugar transport system substrate-binding protein|nr:extracellular solute-binding protein [Nitrososphaeraceae archaeon]
MNKNTQVSFFAIGLVVLLLLSMVVSSGVAIQLAPRKKQVTLTAVMSDLGDPGRWARLLQPALKELRIKHPDMDIKLKYLEIPSYSQTRNETLSLLANQTPVDIVNPDVIWLGEFAQKGYLTDLTNRSISWGRLSDFYQNNVDGMTYNHKIYAIWVWTDVRGMWYWKDLLNESGVKPDSLKTWGGYLASAKKLNAVLRPQGIEGIHLTGASHSPDLWYPYLWMLGGQILTYKNGHLFPAYNSSAGVRAVEFIKAQIDAGIKPQKQHFWGVEFLNKKFAVMLEAVQHHAHLNTTAEKQAFEQKIDVLPFPVPDPSYNSSTLSGGWLLSIPKASKNKDLAWELITLTVEPKILAPWLAKYGYLPTQIPIGNGPYSDVLNQSIPYFEKLISMIPTAGARPSIPQYPQIAEHIWQALDEVYYGMKGPKQALDEAAAKSAKVLGW